MGVKKINLSTAVALAFVIFSSVYLAQSLRLAYWIGYGPGAGFVPSISSGLLLALSIVCFIQSLREDGRKLSDVFPTGVGRINLLVTWTGLIFFTIFAKSFGFMITSVIMLTALFGRSVKWYLALIYAFVLSLISFFLFKSILTVPVPINKFGF